MLLCVVANERRIRMGKKARSLRRSAILELKAWREARLAEIKKREDELADELRAAIPESFAKWREECSPILIPGLIKHGTVSRKYRRGEGEGQVYGYTDLEEFARRFDKLKEAWSGVVHIRIFWEEDHRFEIFFTAI